MVKTVKIVKYHPIGVIHSPFKDLEGMPIQPIGARGIKGEIHLNEEYAEGLEDLEEFSHIIPDLSSSPLQWPFIKGKTIFR